MSALRKIRALREKEAVAARAQEQQPEEPANLVEEPKAKAVANPFDLLEADDNNDEQDIHVHLPQTEPAAEPAKSKKAKPKNKVKKEKEKVVKQDDDENLDKLLQEFKISGESKGVESKTGANGTSSPSSINFLFKTEAKCFDMELEVKKRFGATVMRENKKKRGHGNKFGHLRKTTLVKPSDEWPAFQERSHDMLSLGNHCFQLLATDHTQYLDREYEQWASTHDPQAIVNFSAHHPYHQQCLLTLSHLLESQGDHAAAHKFVMMCVYSLEQCFSADFTIFDGASRVSCELDEHQVLFAALYRHSQLLGKTGCPRTGLEVAKFLLSLSPDRDPQCVLFAIDYLAIRSQEYGYLLSFVSSFDPSAFTSRAPFPGPVPAACHFPPACLLPNMLFNCALAKYFMESKSGGGGGGGAVAVDKGMVQPGWFQHDLHKKSASHLLQCAVLLFPEVVHELLEKANDRELEKESWKPLLSSLEGLQSAHPYVNKLSAIFAERSASLWSDDAVLQWLQLNTAEALSKWPLLKATLREMRGWFFTPSRPVPNHVRMLAKNHYSDEVPSVPDEMRVAAEQAELKQEQEEEEEDFERPEPAGPRDQNPLAVLLMSLLPWYQPRGGPPPPDDDDEQ